MTTDERRELDALIESVRYDLSYPSDRPMIECDLERLRVLLREQEPREPVAFIYPPALEDLRRGRAVRTAIDPRPIDGWTPLFAAPTQGSEKLAENEDSTASLATTPEKANHRAGDPLVESTGAQPSVGAALLVDAVIEESWLLAGDAPCLDEARNALLSFIADLERSVRTQGSEERPTYQCSGCGTFTHQSRAWIEANPCPNCGREHYWTGSFKWPPAAGSEVEEAQIENITQCIGLVAGELGDEERATAAATELGKLLSLAALRTKP